MNQRYVQILQFLETYGGEKYKTIDKCKTVEEKNLCFKVQKGERNPELALKRLLMKLLGDVNWSMAK